MTDRGPGPPGPSGGAPEAAASIDQTLPVVVGPGHDVLTDFRIVAKLGEGSMGIVYKARQLSFDRDVALKILPPTMAGNTGFVERFIREARMSVKLDHPNIVRGVAVGEERGLHYFAMEFIDGRSLDHYLRSAGRLSVGDAVRIVADVARALEHAHSRSILHRDIKPANIMVTRDGEVKLADLGLAKIMDDDGDLTRMGEGAGTPSYMPLEQARSAREVDHRSDIYALGATMYHLLTGQRPFPGATSYEVLRAKETGRYEPASKHSPAVTPALDLIIDRAMASDPARRYQAAGEMIEALDATGLASETLALAWPGATRTAGRGTMPTGRSQPGTRRVPGPPAGQRRGALVGVAVGLAVAAIVGVVGWQLYSRAPAPPPAATRPPTAPGASAPRADAEPADLILARAIGQVTGGDVAAARQTLTRGQQAHPGDVHLQRLLAELGQGTLVLFQYQTPEETSPVLPIWRASGVTLTRRDNYRFAMVAGRACHVYAFQRDTRPSVMRIFPGKQYSSVGNPLSVGQLHWLPEDRDGKSRQWLHLDTSVGEEQVFFVAVTAPLTDADGLGRRLVSGPDRVREELAGDRDSCFASGGSALQSFAFVHK